MKKIIALAALAAITASASAANLLTDGSFESISQAAGTWNVYQGANLPGWTVTPTTHGLEVRNDVAGTAENGANFIELDGYENDKISQSFATVVGKAYEITFFFADRTDVTSAFLQGSGGFAYTYTGAGTTTYSGSFGTGWHEAVIDFVATASSTKFSIWGVGTSDGYGTSFDNFSASTVPEPATLGLFAAGLAVLGLSRRRRQQ